jgi:hypothetical protein
MPSEHKPLIVLRGTAEYAVFLDTLCGAAGARDRSDLAERALAKLAKGHGLKPPRRAAPHGTNRHGEPGT